MPGAEMALPQPITFLLAVQGAQADAQDLRGFLFVVSDRLEGVLDGDLFDLLHGHAHT